ncbi:hypothetical protein [Helicobacter cynogastricus]|uniref:hypothetical protein n=1 Tax=Helicobacter cynogastricus TaxID=329937 RepID=UPI000CF027E6|nr:hypothetical protein [Helicobacter cynogastricus]
MSIETKMSKTPSAVAFPLMQGKQEHSTEWHMACVVHHMRFLAKEFPKCLECVRTLFHLIASQQEIAEFEKELILRVPLGWGRGANKIEELSTESSSEEIARFLHAQAEEAQFLISFLRRKLKILSTTQG